MKRIAVLCIALICYIGNGQVPTPQSTNATISGAQWTKTNFYDFVLYDKNGNKVQDVMDLNYLKTDSLGVFDKTSKTVYVLADFKEAPSGSSGKAVVLAENATDRFYVTNQYSFYTVIHGEVHTGKITNVQGSYIYYVPELDKTFFLEDIRKFNGWGAKAIKDMAYSSTNTYWYRDVENKSYGIVKEGKAIDYSNASTKTDGDDLIVSIDGTPTYRLQGYYTVASFVINPVKDATGYTNSSSSSTNITVGCSRGDCQNGWGKYQFNGGYYEGFWKDGKKHGYGLYQWEGQGKYIGNWADDNMDGYGVYIANNDDNIIGEYKNGQLNGLGISVTGDEWKQGVYSNGNRIEDYPFVSTGNETGCTAGDCQNKYGRMKWSNGDSFTGFFKNGKMFMGSYTFANGDRYSGMFNSNNQFHGMGRFFFKSGEYYGGNWENGKYDGKGYYHDKDLKRQVGIWSAGTLVTKMN